MEPRDIACEEWREYDFGGNVYRIVDPQQLYVGATCHRVVDADGIVHIVPAPGFHGCAIRVKPRSVSKPVEF